MISKLLARRSFVQALTAAGVGAVFCDSTTAYAAVGQTPETLGQNAARGGIDLVIRRQKLNIGGRETSATTVNGSVPGPLLRFRDGENVTIRVKNELQETSSIHWHGLLVPTDMDGVPGVSFPGIKPGETFTYNFKLRQSGTYWYHSHSGTQELSGLYGPIIVDPVESDPFTYDREHVVVFSDWTYEDPNRVVAKLKKLGSYYNFQQRTAVDFFRDASRDGWQKTVADRMLWGRSRMDPTDILDVTGYTYTYLMNGRSPDLNWTALYRAGERVRLRFINASAMTLLDVRIPGLKMTLVQADGQNVQPVTVDEFRIAPAETYDMIVQPDGDQAYTIFAEAMDRSGYAAATLAPRDGMRGEVPARRKRPLRTMADMGMAMTSGAMPGEKGKAPGGMSMPSGGGDQPKVEKMPGMDMPSEAVPGGKGKTTGGMSMPSGGVVQPKVEKMPGMDMPSSAVSVPKAMAAKHGPDHHGPGNSMVAMNPESRLNDPGVGVEGDGRRVLVYTDLRRLQPNPKHREPEREIEMHLTGNMDRQMWSFDGKQYWEAKEPIPFRYGQPLRVTLVNDTMMDHPMHIHGMWMVLDNGAGAKMPNKHTITVKGGEKLSFIVTPDETGKFAFHCHLLLHMELGMFRVVSVSGAPEGANT